MFPDSSEGERKFLVRTDFGSGGDGRHRRRRGSGGRNQQGAGDDGGANPSPSSRGDRRKLFLLVELTCVVQTAKDGTGDPYGDGAAGGGRRGGEGVRGPLKNFRGGGRKRRGRRRVGGIREKAGGGDRDSDSYGSGEGSSSDGDRSGASQVRHLSFDLFEHGRHVLAWHDARVPTQLSCTGGWLHASGINQLKTAGR